MKNGRSEYVRKTKLNKQKFNEQCKKMKKLWIFCYSRKIVVSFHEFSRNCGLEMAFFDALQAFFSSRWISTNLYVFKGIVSTRKKTRCSNETFVYFLLRLFTMMHWWARWFVHRSCQLYINFLDWPRPLLSRLIRQIRNETCSPECINRYTRQVKNKRSQ